VALRFEWDLRKAAANLKKHDVTFQEATSVFRDPLSITTSDPDHDSTASRFLDLGLSHRARLLVVSYIERNGGLRIISARRATRAEQSQYESERA
jgi:uncharacterized DUF497 family protein